MALIDGLVSYWKMDDASGNAVDAEGSNDMTASGTPTYGATGKIGDAITFDANAEYFSKTSPVGLVTGASDRSVNFWAKVSDLSTFPFPFGYGGASTDTGWHFGFRSNGRFRLNLVGAVVESSSGSVVEDTWVMITVVQDSGTQRIYINGSADGTGTRTLNTSTSTLYIGASSQDFNTLTMRGELDEIGFWSKALTTGEITELYNSGNGLAYPFVAGTNMQINIGDAWKSVDGMQINIGDTWKSVNSAKINIGDTWKTIF